MWLPWEYGVALAVACVGVARWASMRNRTQLQAVGAEAAILAGLYALWQLAGQLSVMKIVGAVERGIQIWDFQQWVGLPSEAATQDMILGFPRLVQAANIYYGGAHVPGMGIFLVWMFFSHRAKYPRWRTALAISTGLCLAVQLIPVAPPRLIPELGMVDTAEAYGQSVYSAFGSRIAGQLQAMPSIHVLWAVVIALACLRHGGPIARIVGSLHGLLTMWVVVVTANHYWLDGVGAIALLVPVLAAQSVWARGKSARAKNSGPESVNALRRGSAGQDPSADQRAGSGPRR